MVRVLASLPYGFYTSSSPIFKSPRGILHDPELYPDPETFNPERFLPGSGGQDHGTTADTGGPRPRINDPSIVSLAFGAGKRICPGRHFVDATLFIVAASVLTVFDVSKPKGEPASASESDENVNGIIT
jgi:cytochrome P450